MPARAAGTVLPGSRLPWGNWLICFCAAALLLNGLIGQNGYVETRRLERQYLDELAKLHKLRAENQWLKAYGQALKSDPAAIEDAARRHLGLMKAGEVLFIVTDTPAAQAQVPPTAPPPAPSLAPDGSAPPPRR